MNGTLIVLFLQNQEDSFLLLLWLIKWRKNLYQLENQVNCLITVSYTHLNWQKLRCLLPPFIWEEKIVLIFFVIQKRWIAVEIGLFGLALSGKTTIFKLLTNAEIEESYKREAVKRLSLIHILMVVNGIRFRRMTVWNRM